VVVRVQLLAVGDKSRFHQEPGCESEDQPGVINAITASAAWSFPDFDQEQFK
jgi:hypothetical protein